jgi:hypothetical protein
MAVAPDMGQRSHAGACRPADHATRVQIDRPTPSSRAIGRPPQQGPIIVRRSRRSRAAITETRDARAKTPHYRPDAGGETSISPERNHDAARPPTPDAKASARRRDLRKAAPRSCARDHDRTRHPRESSPRPCAAEARSRPRSALPRRCPARTSRRRGLASATGLRWLRKRCQATVRRFHPESRSAHRRSVPVWRAQGPPRCWSTGTDSRCRS